MSKEFDTLLETLLRSEKAQNDHNAAVGRYCDENTRQHGELWADVGELRDELHALANRLEALTNFVVSDPAEVAAKIVTDANRATLREVRDDA